jgi:uncharacterized phage protein gp47/JayE
MAYFMPYIDESGLHIPTYNDIKQHLIDEAKIIFGEDIYLENDSQDYQFLILMADKIDDCYMTAQLIYNNRSTPTAIGAALDGLLKLNGLRRKLMTKSKCEVIISGEHRTNIINGIIADEENINWDLPDIVTIGADGTVTVTATCQIYSHSITAGRLNRIVTPTIGWVSVINPEDSIDGRNFETDAEAKARQSESTANPSRTVLEGTDGAIAAIDDVTRRRVYENKTNIWQHGLPPHSITAVVEGGGDYAVAETIYNHKTPGCDTFGDIEIYVERDNIFDIVDLLPVSFFRPVYKEVFVTVYIKKLAGYSSAVDSLIISSNARYLNSIRIGDNLILSALWGISATVNQSIERPSFSIINITAGFSGDQQFTTDLELAFNEVTLGKEENINIIFV